MHVAFYRCKCLSWAHLNNFILLSSNSNTLFSQDHHMFVVSLSCLKSQHKLCIRSEKIRPVFSFVIIHFPANTRGDPLFLRVMPCGRKLFLCLVSTWGKFGTGCVQGVTGVQSYFLPLSWLACHAYEWLNVMCVHVCGYKASTLHQKQQNINNRHKCS